MVSLPSRRRAAEHLEAKFGVSERRACKLLLPRWIERVQGPLTPFTYREKPIRASHAKRLAKYLVKGTEPAFLEHFFLREMHDEHGPQGEIWGKRAGVSPALGHTVRRAAAFRPRRRRSEGDRLAA